MPYNTLAIRLREARLMRGLSMDKLIELADFVVTKQSLSRYERGIMRPHANVVSALAKALDISEDYFLGTNILIDMPMLRTTSGGKLQEDVLTAIEARLAYWTERLLAKERTVGISREFRVYTNVGYPFSNNPPNANSGMSQYGVTDHNATGFYRRTINIPATWKDKRVFVHFDGVYSAAVVWVNGKYVGYSQSSNTDAEFDITGRWNADTRTVDVLHRLRHAAVLEPLQCQGARHRPFRLPRTVS